MTTTHPPKGPALPPPTTHDNLTPLPPELLQQIASHLYATHTPNLAQLDLISRAYQPTPKPHSLLSLSLVSKTLHAHTNAWAHHHLHTHRAITKYKVPKKASARGPSPLPRLLRWSATHCVFCGKKSVRRAIMMNGLRCCKGCDRVEWEGKITKTQAKKEFKLGEEVLLPKSGAGDAGDGAGNVRRVRYGTYWSQGVLTTMFMREDVKALAERVKGGEEGRGGEQKRKREREVVVIDDEEEEDG